METELERLTKLKEEAKANPLKKVKGCKDCKKKKEITALPKLEEEPYIPSLQDIKIAYAELTSYGGVKDDKKEFINKVYKALFGRSFDFKCRGCSSVDARIFSNYIKENKIEV